MDLPVNVDTGTVVGRYIVKVIDGVDPNQDPDAVPVRGRIVFTASVPYLPDPTASPDPVTIMTAPIVAVLDDEGYLCTPYSDTGEPMYRGVKLAATDDPDIAVQNWTWDVTYIFEPVNGHKLAIPAHGFALPSGETVDLTKVAKVPSSPGYSLPQAEAAVLRAEAIAQSIRDDADAGLFNGEAATLEIGDVVSGPSAGVVNVGDEQHAILNITLEKGDKGDTGNGVPDAGEAFQLIRMDEIAGTTEWVTPSKELVGLAQVDNTSDADKPVSGPVELALSEKADAETVSLALAEKADTTAVNTALEGKETKYGTRGTTRRIYVRADGSDSNGGTSASDAFREIRAAVASLNREGPILRGSIIIDVGAGTYKGGIQLPTIRGYAADDFLKIIGPNVGGHPNVPTAIIDHAADPAATFGILASNGYWLWTENIKIQGAFNTGLDARSNCVLQRRNTHIDGASIGVNVTSYTSDNATGGIVENCTLYAVQEMFGVVRTYSGGSGGATIFRNNKYGIYSKTSQGGHLDYAVFEGNQVAIHLDRSSANLTGVSIAGSTVAGISLKDAEIHNETTVVWGAGGGRRIISYGPSTSESSLWGWSGSDPQSSVRTGLRPLICLGQSYTDTAVSGTTSATTVASWATVLPADRYAVKGKRLSVKVVGTVGATLTATLVIRLEIAGQTPILASIPSGTTAGIFHVDFDMVCSADGNNQKFTARHLTQAGSSRAYYAAGSLNLTDSDRTVSVQFHPGSTADSATANIVELYG